MRYPTFPKLIQATKKLPLNFSSGNPYFLVELIGYSKVIA